MLLCVTFCQKMVKNTKNSCVVRIFFVPLQSKMQTVVKNTARLFSANVIAQALGLIVYPILTRMYTPDAFGALGVFVGIGSVLVLLATAEYQYAIVLPRRERDARAAAKIALLLMCAATAILLLLSPLLSAPVSRWFNAPSLAKWLWMLPFFVIGSGLWNVLSHYYIRANRFAWISRYKVIQSLMQVGFKTGLGALGFTASGLLISSVLAPCLAGLYTLLRHARSFCRHLIPITYVEMRETAYAYRYFPIYSTPRGLVNSLSVALPALLLTRYFGLAEAGFFTMAVTISSMPISMIVGSVQQVLFNEASCLVNARQSLRVLRRLNMYTLLLIVPCFVLLWFVLPQLTAWLLGTEWEVSGRYIRWMLPWLLMTCLNGPICFVADIFMKQKIGLFYEILLLLAKFAGLGIGIYKHDIVWAVAGFSIMSALALTAQLGWFHALIWRYERTLSNGMPPRSEA